MENLGHFKSAFIMVFKYRNISLLEHGILVDKKGVGLSSDQWDNPGENVVPNNC